MRAYDFTAPASLDGALRDAHDGSAYLAGGTTLVDLMKLEVMTPSRVVDINRLLRRLGAGSAFQLDVVVDRRTGQLGHLVTTQT